MACCGGSGDGAVRNKAINRDLATERKNMGRTVKLLLLGGIILCVENHLPLTRCWRFWEEYSCQTDEDHSLGWFFGGGKSEL